MALLAALAGIAMAASIESSSLITAIARAVGYAVAGFLIGAVAGKLFGLLRARRRFVARTRGLLEQLRLLNDG